MNIFALSDDPREAAQMHLDKHAVRMPLEYAQLLSTAHRLLDGTLEERVQPSTGRRKKFHVLPGEKIQLQTRTEGGYLSLETLQWVPEVTVSEYKIVKPRCYGATHANHPCAIWTRASDSNYRWLAELLRETSSEYKHRYGRTHRTWSELGEFLLTPPTAIPIGPRTPFALAMNEEFRSDDPVAAYRSYYLGPKATFARWTNRSVPTWFQEGIENYDDATYARTTSVR